MMYVIYTYSKNISDVKKGEPKKKRYTSKIVYNSSIQSKLSKYTIFFKYITSIIDAS